MRGSWPELRVEVSAGACIMLSLMLLVLPLPWVLTMLACVFTHEMGHLLAARLLSVPVFGITFDHSGARIETGPMEPPQEILCALAGPLAGCLLIALGRWFPLAALFAFLQTGFNLLPLGTLDGGRVLRCIRSLCRKRPCKPGQERVQ